MERFSCGEYYDRIGGNVRKIRMEKGLTQEKLAEKTELSLTVIQKVETGQSGSRLETLIRIAFVLGVSLDVLMDMKEGMNGTGTGRKRHICCSGIKRWVRLSLQ